MIGAGVHIYRAGGSARVAKVLAFASFGLQILESDMSCNVFTLCILLIMSCNVLLVCHELCKPHIILILYVTGSGKRDIFAHIFKIELLAPQGRVSSQL